MILIHWKFWTVCCTVIQTYLIFSAVYAYKTNAKRATDDPGKKEYPASFPWLAPIIFPVVVLINIPVFILSTLAFAFFLVLFPFGLLLFRKPFLIKWLLEKSLKIGNQILKINVGMLRIVGVNFAPSKASI